MPEKPDSDREVLTSLPRSRPVRRSAKRADRPAAESAARASSKPVAPRKPRAAKAAPKGDASATAPPQRKAAARTARPRATPPPPPAAGERPADPRDAPRRKVPAAGYATPDARETETSVSAGAELVSTTIQAAAELAQIGFTVGRQTLRSMLDRLPKP